MRRRFDPSGPLRGTLRAPGDKSISHRAALMGAMCADPVHVTGYLDAADTRSTLDAVRALGALVEEGAPGTLTIRGPGLRAAVESDDRRGQRRHADAAAAGLAGRAARRGLDARRRRLDPPPAGRPHRRAAGRDGRADRGA